MNDQPRAQSDGLVVEHLDGGLVVYDTRTDQAHALDASAARAWAELDGRRTAPEIARWLGADSAAVLAAIDQLGAAGLLAGVGPISRRHMLRRAAVVGAGSLAAAPVIDTVLIPTPPRTRAPCRSQAGAGVARRR
jgi:hypothetical protein